MYPFSYALNNLYTSEFKKANPNFPPSIGDAGLWGNLSSGGPSGNLYGLFTVHCSVSTVDFSRRASNNQD